MKARLSLVVVTVLVLIYSGKSQMPKQIKVTNGPSSLVSIVPLDETNTKSFAGELVPFVAKLPQGSFLLQNKRAVPITAVVAQWRFIGTSGKSESRQIQCDGYIVPPVRSIVDKQDVALITPGACTRGALFSQLDGSSLGSPLTSTINRKILESAGTVDIVEVTVDSVIFEDGAIWGPDTQQYYAKIFERHVSSQAFVKDVSDAVAKGEDIREHAKKIKQDAASKGDKESALRGHYASVLASSPNPEATLKQLHSREELPEFHHIKEDLQ